MFLWHPHIRSLNKLPSDYLWNKLKYKGNDSKKTCSIESIIQIANYPNFYLGNILCRIYKLPYHLFLFFFHAISLYIYTYIHLHISMYIIYNLHMYIRYILISGNVSSIHDLFIHLALVILRKHLTCDIYRQMLTRDSFVLYVWRGLEYNSEVMTFCHSNTITL